MLTEGYPAYTTSCAWLGYSDELLTQVTDLHITEFLTGSLVSLID